MVVQYVDLPTMSNSTCDLVPLHILHYEFEWTTLNEAIPHQYSFAFGSI